MELTDQNYFCVTSSDVWQFAGFVLFAIKVVIPLIIIILGIIDFVNATVATKDEAVVGATKSMFIRILIGVAIFFVPLIISLIFNLIEKAAPVIAAADACQRCLLRPFTDECTSYVNQAKNNRDDAGTLDSDSHDQDDYISKKESCYFCTDEKKYVWDLKPSCKNYQSMVKFETRAQCENPKNLTDVPNLVEHQEEDENKPGKALTKEQLEAEFAKLTTIPKYSDLVKMAKDMYGMSEEEFKVALGWAKGEGYERIPNSSGKIDYYLGYLCDCVGLNFYKGYGTTSAQELADKIRGRGPLSLYSLDAFYNKAQAVIDAPNTYANTLKIMYLVLKYPDENAHDCDGLSNYAPYGGTVYYYGGYYGGYQTKVWSLYYDGFTHWATESKKK